MHEASQYISEQLLQRTTATDHAKFYFDLIELQAQNPDKLMSLYANLWANTTQAERDAIHTQFSPHIANNPMRKQSEVRYILLGKLALAHDATEV